MFKFNKTITLLLFVILTNTAQAQNTETIGLLLNQAGAINQLEGISAPEAANSSTPTSQSSNTANALDVLENQAILVQSDGDTESKTSIVQQYFKILTGEQLEVYGAQEFSQKQDNKLLFFNTIGKNYQLAPGDIIRVTLRGLNSSDRTYQINNNGILILPDLRPIAVSGVTISDLEKTLQTALGYDDASAEVFISLETARLITVQISGAVNQPRTLAVPAYTPLSRVLAYAGGVKSNGSLRNIILRNRDGSIEEVDFYKFLQSPTGSNDPVVTDSSRIFVPNQGPTVAAFGFVARPGIYELAVAQPSITVKDFLALSGTSIIPPGLVLEAKFFNDEGILNTRELTPNDSILAGEVLNLRFVQTRLQNTISVLGAVLDEYSMATSKPINVFDLLKGGATLKPDTKLNFAMIVEKDGTATAIDLTRALQNRSRYVPVGANLIIFDEPSYQRLVNADRNISNDPLVAAVDQAELAELYLNGKRQALIANDNSATFASILRPHYRITPETNLNLAIVETTDGDTKAVDLRDILQDPSTFSVMSGMKIHLFETTFLTNFMKRHTDRTNTIQLQADLEQSAPLARLLSRANVTRIKLDKQLVAVLPDSSSQQISTILDVLGLERSVTDLADFVELELNSQTINPEFSSVSLLGDYKSKLPSKRTISFWSNDGLTKHLRALNRRELTRLSSIGVSVLLDYKLQNILSPNAFLTLNSTAAELISDRNIYQLFSLIEQRNKLNGTWETKIKSPRNLLASKTNTNALKINAGDQISLFTKDFIRNTNVQVAEENEETPGLASQKISDFDSEISQDFGSTALLEERGIQLEAQEKLLNLDDLALRSDALMRSYSRTITGAVQRPGKYPVAEKVTISQLIKAAGGELNVADKNKVMVQFLDDANGTIRNGQKLIVDIKATNPTLRGSFYINVPFLVNEAATGTVTLSGEILYPGDYVIARDETVHDLIERAGGLSTVAYPLGAIFARESLKNAERDNNAVLASELEQSVAQVASSTNPNAADQAKMLLGYANQLRAQSATGRMPVNIISTNKNVPIFLQDGDSLFVPKRPSHIIVMGAVNRKTVAAYNPKGTIDSYLFAAGGKTKFANMKNSYLILPNGESTPISREMPVPPGAVIVIIPHTDRLNVLGLTDLISRVLGNIATSILAINNVR